MRRLLFVSALSVLSGSAVLGPTLLAPAPYGNPNAPASGLLMGSPLGWTTQQTPEIQVKGPGFYTGPTPTPTGVPDVDFAAFVPSLVADLGTSVSPLLAMSLGIDVISTTELDVSAPEPPDPTWHPGPYPVLGVGTHGWYAIEFTVDTDQLQDGEHLADDVLYAVDPEASVFCYVLPDSSTSTGGQYLLPNESETTCILLPTHLGISSKSEEIHAINMHMGLYKTDMADSSLLLTRPLPTNPTLYFTLRPEFITSVGAIALATHLNIPAEYITAGTIFKSTWTDAGWSSVSVYTTAEKLKIPQHTTAIIDGLAIDVDNGEMIFSLRSTEEHPVGPSDQMLHTYPPAPTDPPRRVVIKVNGRHGPLGRHMGAGRGIGDFCTGDPWIQTRRSKTFNVTSPTLLDDYQFARRKPNPLVGPKYVVLPITALRAWSGGRTKVRVCMATPRDLAAGISSGVVKLYSSHTDDVTVGHAKSPWRLVAEFALPPGPFQREFPLTKDSGTPPPTVRGIVVRWELHADGEVWHSPVAALRY